jgi:hypothetical protein
VRGHRCWHDNSAMASSHGTNRSSFLFSTQNERERERETKRGGLWLVGSSIFFSPDFEELFFQNRHICMISSSR